jgi:hypothetical protein
MFFVTKKNMTVHVLYFSALFVSFFSALITKCLKSDARDRAADIFFTLCLAGIVAFSSTLVFRDLKAAGYPLLLAVYFLSLSDISLVVAWICLQTQDKKDYAKVPLLTFATTFIIFTCSIVGFFIV